MKSNKSKPYKLKELAATAISGNDISSSCLYVSALAIIYAGQYAWISLLMVAGILYLFRKIYAEVVGAIPLNGGAYNALLNTSSKFTASLAGCCTILSYIATSVISANEAMNYVHKIWNGLPVILATVALLACFMLLTIIGIKESSRVAIIIFLFHLASLILLSSFCIIYILSNGFGVLIDNYHLPVHDGIIKTIFFGFSAAMLGISGFESSANYVEKQAPGVFPKTLRNMWIIVSIFNPLIALLAISVMPISFIIGHKEALLAEMGGFTGGNWLAFIISIDAALVLSGAVLTSFIGINGLVQRMTLDRIIPGYFLKKNKNGVTYRITAAFFLLSTSILLITKGELKALAGVYTISFLSVMILFGIGNALLKIKRAKLPRPVKAPVFGLFIAICAVVTALIGNIAINPTYLKIFIDYFFPTMLLVIIMLYRIPLLKALFFTLKYFKILEKIHLSSYNKILKLIVKITSQEFVFFTSGDRIDNLNKVMMYIIHNENTRNIKVVKVLHNENEVPSGLEDDIKVLNRAYPDIRINFQKIYGEFTPELVDKLSKKWNIPKNFMFIGTPCGHLQYKVEEFGGVRLVI